MVVVVGDLLDPWVLASFSSSSLVLLFCMLLCYCAIALYFLYCSSHRVFLVVQTALVICIVHLNVWLSCFLLIVVQHMPNITTQVLEARFRQLE